MYIGVLINNTSAETSAPIHFACEQIIIQMLTLK